LRLPDDTLESVVRRADENSTRPRPREKTAFASESQISPMPLFPEKQIAQLVQMACVLEACAPKPGNVIAVTIFPTPPWKTFSSARLPLARHLKMRLLPVSGRIILDAITSTRRWVKPNTNLGMVLLFAPLVKACIGVSDADKIRSNLQVVFEFPYDRRCPAGICRHSRSATRRSWNSRGIRCR